MLRTKFEEDLTELHQQFYTMGIQVSKAVHQAVRAFIRHDLVLAKDVIEKDVTINEQEIKLEKKSFEMIALQQPVTSDLRMIVTIMKASSDLERMGDHAVSIAKSTIHVKGQTRIIEVEDYLTKMSDLVKEMTDEVMETYLKGDEKKARKIAKKDGQVDEMFKQIYRLTIQSMEENPDTVVSGSDYLQVSSYLERIGDYVTNICEWIVYFKTGKMVELNDKQSLMLKKE